MISGGDASGKTAWRILIAGTGGQGVLTAARLLSEYFVEKGHEVVSGQLHGMARRAGAVQASVMIDAGISPVMRLGSCDCVLGFEPMEAVRAVPYMSSGTTVLMNQVPVIPSILGQRFARKKQQHDYPDLHVLAAAILGVTNRLHQFDATKPARDSGSIATLNSVMLGCMFAAELLPYRASEFWSTLTRRMSSSWIEMNQGAFESGKELGRQFRATERVG